MRARHVRLSWSATFIALGVCLTCTSGFGDVQGGWGQFFQPGATPAHEAASGSSQSHAVAVFAQTAGDRRSRVVPAGCGCRSTKSQRGRGTEKLEPIPEPVPEVARTPVKVADPVLEAAKRPVKVAEPRLLPWWEETRQSGFFPTPIVSMDITDQTDLATTEATSQTRSEPPPRKTVVDTDTAKRRYFRDAIHVTVSDAGVVLVHK